MATETKIHSARATYRRDENGEPTRYFLTLSEAHDRNNGFICESIPLKTEEDRQEARTRTENEHFSEDLSYFKTIYGIKKLADGENIHLMHEEDFYKEYPQASRKEETAPNRLYIVNPDAHKQHIDGIDYREQISFTSVPHPEKNGENLMLFKGFGYEPEALITMQRDLHKPEDKTKFIERKDLYNTVLKELHRKLPERMAKQDKDTQEYGEALRQEREEKQAINKAAKDEQSRKARKEAIRRNMKKSQEKKEHIESVQPDLLQEADNQQKKHQQYLDEQEPMSSYAHKAEDFTFDPDTQELDDDFQR